MRLLRVKGYRAPSVPGAMIVVDGNVCFSVIGSGNFTDPAVVAELASCPADDVIWGWAGKTGANAPAGPGPNTAPAGPACSQMAKVTGTFVVAFKQEIGLWDGPMQSLKPRVTIHNGSSLAIRMTFEGAARTSNPLHPTRAVNGTWKSWPEIKNTVAARQTMTADVPPANGNIPLVPKGRIEKFDVFAVVSAVASPGEELNKFLLALADSDRAVYVAATLSDANLTRSATPAGTGFRPPRHWASRAQPRLLQD